MITERLKQTETKTGWVLEFAGKFWGVQHPEDRSFGGHRDILGWVDQLDKIRIAVREECPPNKNWFNSDNDESARRESGKGTWIRVEMKTTRTLTPID